ncbi:hypothetical protein [Candidatus Proelusimicrobium excrementi]|uniref:hypothetical protein n=1 Tax=Candidatus Proelusimicrobium excrementi TaxID=3416222 RepID=UPI003C873106|nr:hypothetical protein [Elusimicrobiaceae bacterium]
MSEEIKFKTVLIKTLKILGVLYCLLAVVFTILIYGLNKLERPYHKRQIPTELTPWLK